MAAQDMANAQGVCLPNEFSCVYQPKALTQVRKLLNLLKFRGKMSHPNDGRAIIFLHLKYKRPAIVQDRKNRIARAAEDCGKALGRKRAWKEAGGENKGNDIETAIALYNNSPACSKLSRHEYALVRRAAGLHQDGEFEPYRWWLDVIAGVVLMAGLIYYAIWLLFM